LSLTFNGFLKKTLSKSVHIDEYMFVMCHIIIISTYIYITIKYICGKNKIRKNLLSKLDKKTKKLFIICGINAIFASALFVYLLKSKDVSYIVPHTSSLLIVCTIFIGYYFYEEVINEKKIIGIILVLIGLFCINMKDNKSLPQSNV
tara:strand:- start:2631 stop:3071 length:441 start_codon:yes stop_codon:yes gene_type:complete